MGKDASSLGFAPKSQAFLGLASTLTRQGKSVRFQLLRAVFFAPTLSPSSKQNIKGVTGKNSNTVFVTKCDSNVVKRRGQQGWQEC